MSVIKVKIQKDFTVLYNGVLEDPNLSFKAKGLWAYCMSRPENWEFHVSHLAKVSKEKEKSIYAALEELMEAGLVTRIQQNKKKGERQGREGFGKMEYTIYPYPQEIQINFAQRRFVHTQNAHTQKDGLVNKEENKKGKDHLPQVSKEPEQKPATPEEEEEISRRIKERPKNAPKIASNSHYREKVLQDIRSSKLEASKQAETRSERIERHKSQACAMNGKIHNGFTVKVCLDRVEFKNSKKGIFSVGYDIPDEEWDSSTGFEYLTEEQ